MKWLKRIALAFAALVALGVVTLLVLGQRADAGRSLVRIVVERPPAQVFRWISERDRLKQWIAWTEEIRVVVDTPQKVGSREIFVMKDPNMGGERVELESELTAWEQDRHVATKLTATMGFEGRVDYTLTEPSAGRTELVYDSRFTYSHPVARLFEPLVTPQATKKLVEDLARLKKLAEAEPATP